MDYQAIVIGGGHAGLEAALALGRLGHRTLLITQNPDAIGRLSCNPAVGGLAKGNLVREIDALGGQMGLLADASTIQFRMLNRSRGPAVQAPRAQVDKNLYQSLARSSAESCPNLSILMDTVIDLIPSIKGDRVEGVITERGSRIGANVVVLTTGTFMEGRLFIGEWRGSGGRLGEPAASGLGPALRRLGFPVGRLKTGTPARVKSASLDFSLMECQPGDEDSGNRFSFLDSPQSHTNVPCWITWTNTETHNVIRKSIGRSPLFSGDIVGRGPRYCPSIEDKVIRFPQRDSHQIFVEPEGLGTDELYLNGLSSSLPEEVQVEFIRTLPGFSGAIIVRPGYAVEYDFIAPSSLDAALESRILRGLFIAGQTNGTSGYEEAAAQGLVAGINAAARLQGKPPLLLGREEAYIGVLVDDLVTLNPVEPYRMFTSRAERRLALRQDTADRRLSPAGRRIGLVDDARWEKFMDKIRGIEQIARLMSERKISHSESLTDPSLVPHVGKSLLDAIRDDHVTGGFARFCPQEALQFEAEWISVAELDAKYSGYEAKEERLVSRFEKSERMRIPENFDYSSVPGLSAESIEKLSAAGPLTLGQAARIPGVRKSDAALVLVRLLRREQEGQTGPQR